MNFTLFISDVLACCDLIVTVLLGMSGITLQAPTAKETRMQVSIGHTGETKRLGRQEGFLHYVAREGRTALRWLVGVCIVAIVLLMVSPGFFFLAAIPALLLLAAYVLLILTNEVERRSDSEAHDALARYETAVVDEVVDDHTDDDQLEPVNAEIVKRESRTAIAIVVAVMITAVLVAGILFDWKVVAIGALVVFAYMLLVAAPLWAGWFNDDIEITSRRMKDLPDTATARTGEPD